MKKLLVLIALAVAGMAMTACSTETASDTLNTKEDIIGFSAMSSVIALESSKTQTLSVGDEDKVMKLSETTTDDTTTEPGTTTEPDGTADPSTMDLLAEIEALEDYLPVIHSFLGDSSGYAVEVASSDMESYEKKMMISVTDIDNDVKTYEFHYNETFDEDHVDEDEDEDEDGDEASEEDQDDERDSTLEGIMIVGGTTYTMTGEREVETGEESLEMIASLDDDNYVIIEYESETEDDEVETEFLSETYQNGEMIRMTEIEFESENDETELNLHFIEGDNESIFEFEHEPDEENTFEITFEIIENGSVVDEGKVEAQVIITDDNQTTLRYTVEREGRDDEVIEDDYDDDDDEDDEDEDEDENDA